VFHVTTVLTNGFQAQHAHAQPAQTGPPPLLLPFHTAQFFETGVKQSQSLLIGSAIIPIGYDIPLLTLPIALPPWCRYERVY